MVAGAGSGKTRVLTRRIAWRILTDGIHPERVLTLTFTRRAANELRRRIRTLGLRDPVPAGTFHSVAMNQLRQRWAERGIAAPKLLDRKVRFLAQILGPAPAKGSLSRGMAVEASDVAAEIDWARARMIEPADYDQAATAAGRRSPLPEGELGAVMVRYQQEKRRKRLVDFDDLLMLAIRDLRADPHYAEAVRWRHRHFFVDEFQDVNPLQHTLLQQWLGSRDDLFVVGDPKQAIYSWNGADPALLDDLADEAGVSVVRLEDNFRSTPQILRASAAAIGMSAMRETRGAGDPATATEHPSDQAEADALAQAVRRAKSVERPWADQAVLVRTNAQLVVIEDAMGQLGIPCRLRGGPGPLASPVVKTELRVIGRTGVDLIERLEDIDERIAADQVIAGGRPVGPAAERVANLTVLSSLIHEYVTMDDRPTGPGLLAWLHSSGTTEDAASGLAETEDAVDLVTFHAAKGLEWPTVHVAGLEDGLVPIAYATTVEQQAEERRLFYVALSRAGDQLHLHWATERTFGVSTMTREPSPFLAEVRAAIDDPSGPTRRPVDWRPQLETARRQISEEPSRGRRFRTEPNGDGAEQSEEVPVLDQLRQWRQRKATAAGVATHVILDDRVLQMIDQTRPTTLAQLAACPGFGPARLARWGDDVLAIVADSERDRSS